MEKIKSLQSRSMFMKRLFAVSAAILLSASTALSTAAFAAENPPPGTSNKAFPANSTSTVTIGEFMDNPKLKPILDKYLPGFSDNEQVGMARGLTLRAIQAYSPDTLTDESLGNIDAEVSGLPSE
jgi:hypothetical protein